MKIRLRHMIARALLAGALAAPPVSAQVVVDIVGDSAHATISLLDEHGATFEAEAIIDFHAPQNLSRESLNLTAELFDPADPAIAGRMPAGIQPTADFPMIVTVEPPVVNWLFRSGFEAGQSPTGSLSFRDAYDFELHTHHLVYAPGSPYRLLKAPVGGDFVDITSDVLSGSTRARGRGGAFSQFMIGVDERLQLLVALDKLIALDARLLTAVLDDLLRLDLVGLLVQVNTALLVPLLGCQNAQAPLAEFRAEVDKNAGTGIANAWRAERDLANDAGELESLAATLQFTLLRCASGQ